MIVPVAKGPRGRRELSESLWRQRTWWEKAREIKGLGQQGCVDREASPMARAQGHVVRMRKTADGLRIKSNNVNIKVRCHRRTKGKLRQGAALGVAPSPSNSRCTACLPLACAACPCVLFISLKFHQVPSLLLLPLIHFFKDVLASIFGMKHGEGIFTLLPEPRSLGLLLEDM